MNYYETLYIIHPSMEAGRLKDIIMGVEDSLKKLGGEPLAVELWGKRKLSYHIDKQKYGTYVLLQYNGEGKCTNDFAVELEHNPNILAYLTTAIESNDVLEIEEDLDKQISGKTRESEKIQPAKPEIITVENESRNRVPETSKSAESEFSDVDNNTPSEKDEVKNNNIKNKTIPIEDEAEAVSVADIKTEENESNQSEIESNQENADEKTAETKEE
jgi:small subunit ribosomal protein S6